MKVNQKLMLALVGVLVAALVMTMSCLPPEGEEPEAPFIEVSSLSYDPEHKMGKIDFAISVDASSSYLVEVDATDFSQLNLAQDSFVGWTSIEGEPKIPVVRMSVAIPPGMDDDISIDIEVPTLTGKIEEVLIAPVEKYEAPEELPTYEVDEESYDSTELYPDGWNTEPRLEFFSGFEIVMFEIHPVKYLPRENDIYFYDIEGSVIFTGDFPDGEAREATLFEPTLQDLTLNYEEAKSWPAYEVDVDPISVENIIAALEVRGICIQDELPVSNLNYMIIIAADDYILQALALEAHKESRANNPIPTVVVPVQVIIDAVPRGDIPHRIRTFIRIMYWLYGPPYVMLLGDVYTMGGAYLTHEPPEQSYFELGSEAGFQYCAQSFRNAEGVVSAGVAITRVNNPAFNITVGIKETLSTDAPDLVSFQIQPSEVKTSPVGDEVWIHKHFAEHVDLDPTQTYYLVVYTNESDSDNYYKVWRQLNYEPDSVLSTYPPFAGVIGSTNADIIFALQLYNSSSVPARYVKIKQGGWYAEGGWPSDYYYACLDYDLDAWDDNRNGVYCEYPYDQATMDFAPEAAVGRLPASTVTQAITMMQRIIDHENSQLYNGNSLIYCTSLFERISDLWSAASQGDSSVNTNTPSWQWIVDYNSVDVVIKDSVATEKLTITGIQQLTDHLQLDLQEPLANSYSEGPDGEVIYRLPKPFYWTETEVKPILEGLGGTCSLAWDYEYDMYFPRLDIFEAQFNSGVEAVQLGGHGSPSGMGGDVRLNPWITTDFVQCNLDVTSTFPVIFAMACSTSYYDLNSLHASYNIGRRCLAEEFLVTGKASGYVGSSRLMTYSPDFRFLNHWFWVDYVYTYGRCAGAALASAKISTYVLWGMDSSAPYHILALELLGDPETHV